MEETGTSKLLKFPDDKAQPYFQYIVIYIDLYVSDQSAYIGSQCIHAAKPGHHTVPGQVAKVFLPWLNWSSAGVMQCVVI